MGRGPTASKDPIGSTNHQWEEHPLMEVSLYTVHAYEKNSHQLVMTIECFLHSEW
jgi:hypothetical protein